MPLAEPALQASRDGKVRFTPERWTKVYEGWLENGFMVASRPSRMPVGALGFTGWAMKDMPEAQKRGSSAAPGICLANSFASALFNPLVRSLQSASTSSAGEISRRLRSRAIENLAYVVTFRQIDPFYVLDLSDPTNPTIAGEAAIAKPPRPTVSVMAESPMSGLASSAVNYRDWHMTGHPRRCPGPPFGRPARAVLAGRTHGRSHPLRLSK